MRRCSNTTGSAPTTTAATCWRALIYGFRISVLFGLSLTIVSSIIGVAAGAVQGYFGGWTDLLFQRFIEIWTSVPELYLLLIISSVLVPGFFVLLGILLLFSWVRLVGLVRAEFLRGRNFEYILAARALGVSNAVIMFRHLLPNAMVATMTFLPFIMSSSVMTLTALDFLGFGLPPGSPSLGELLSQGKANVQAPWLGLTGFFTVAHDAVAADLHRRGGARRLRSAKDACLIVIFCLDSEPDRVLHRLAMTRKPRRDTAYCAPNAVRQLLAGLREAREQRFVYERPGPGGLVQFIYSDRCVYDGAWTPFTWRRAAASFSILARAIVATPFPKFFNIGERGEPGAEPPSRPWKSSTAASSSFFITTAAGEPRPRVRSNPLRRNGRRIFSTRHDLAALKPGTTYLAEAIYPENKIVVRYTESGLILLAAYDGRGVELTYHDVEAVGTASAGERCGAMPSRRCPICSAMPRRCRGIEEGFVIRFDNGHRLKIKGNEYRRIHALISPSDFTCAVGSDGGRRRFELDPPGIARKSFGATSTIRGLLDASCGVLLEKPPASPIRRRICPTRMSGCAYRRSTTTFAVSFSRTARAVAIRCRPPDFAPVCFARCGPPATRCRAMCRLTR